MNDLYKSYREKAVKKLDNHDFLRNGNGEIMLLFHNDKKSGKPSGETFLIYNNGFNFYSYNEAVLVKSKNEIFLLPHINLGIFEYLKKAKKILVVELDSAGSPFREYFAQCMGGE